MKPEAPRAGDWGAAAVASQPPRAQDLRRAGGVGTVGRGGTVGLARGEECFETEPGPPGLRSRGASVCVQRRVKDGAGAAGCQREKGRCRVDGLELELRHQILKAMGLYGRPLNPDLGVHGRGCSVRVVTKMVTVVNSTHPQTGLAITAVRARRSKGDCVLQRADAVGRWAQVGAATERGGWVDGACRREPWAPWLSLPLALISGWEARAAPAGLGGLEEPGGPAAPEPGPGSPAEAGPDRGPGGPGTVAGLEGLGGPGTAARLCGGPGPRRH